MIEKVTPTHAPVCRKSPKCRDLSPVDSLTQTLGCILLNLPSEVSDSADRAERAWRSRGAPLPLLQGLLWLLGTAREAVPCAGVKWALPSWAALHRLAVAVSILFSITSISLWNVAALLCDN